MIASQIFRIGNIFSKLLIIIQCKYYGQVEAGDP